MISWWGGYLGSNWPILKQISEYLPLAKCKNVKIAFQLKTKPFAAQCIIQWSYNLVWKAVFTLGCMGDRHLHSKVISDLGGLGWSFGHAYYDVDYRNPKLSAI